MVIKKKKKTTNKKKVKKKVKRKKRAKNITIEEIYIVINKVQVSKKEKKFSTSLNNASVVENIINDVQLEYDRIDLKTKVNFVLFPNEESYDEEEFDIFDLDILSDEILEDGQCFQ